MHPVTVESVLADIARLSVEERQVLRLRLNMAAYGASDDFGKHMTGYVIPPAPGT